MNALPVRAAGLAIAFWIASARPAEVPAPADAGPPTVKPVAAQPAATTDYEIALWPCLMLGALSLTFDDGGEKHFSVTVPQLTERKLRGTFFITTSWIGKPKYGTWDQVRAAAAAGQEIGSHTISHGYGEGPDEALKGSRDAIDREVPAQRCVCISYPSGGYHAKAGGYYITGRMAGKHFFYGHHPVQMMHVEDYIMGAPGPQEMRDLAEQALAKRAWAVVTYHYPGDQFGAALDALKGYADRLVIAPMGEVAKYTREARAATLELVARDATGLRLRLSDGLPDEVYNQPLTLVLPLPDGWKDFAATQGDRPVWRQMREKKIAFEAVPDAGEIALRPAQP